MQDHLLPHSLARRDAFELLSALDAYELAAERVVRDWFDVHAYADVTRRIEAIRTHGASVPALTVVSLQLVIAHTELLSMLWQNACTGGGVARLAEVQERHAACVASLRAAALRLLRND